MHILIVSLYPLERNTSVANSSISIVKGLLALGHCVTMLMPEWPTNDTGVDLSAVRVVRVPGLPDQHYNSQSKWVGKMHSHFDVLDVSRGYMKSIGEVVIPDEFFDVVLSLSDPKVSHLYTNELIKLKKIRYGRWIQHWGDPIKEHKWTKMITECSKVSLGIYMVHMFVLIEVFFRMQRLIPNPLLLIPLCVTVVFAVSAVLPLIIRKMPFIGKWLV